VRLTAAQTLIRFLANQYVECDRVERRFFGVCFGIVRDGNAPGIGEAFYRTPGGRVATVVLQGRLFLSCRLIP
jgi:TPP-dependent trihydroxycyclohexane-1,2-dione (THcHDO) dehydratase